MKLPSVEHLVARGRASATRFPLALAAAVVSAAAAVVAAGPGDDDPWIRLLAAASPGIPLFVAVRLLTERHRLSAAVTAALRTLGVALLATFYWRWSAWSGELAAIRYFHLSAGLHLAAAVVAYVGIDEPRGFWQFNRALFLRFLIGAVYSAVLFVGLALALAGLDNLLGVSVPGEAYFRLWIVIAFLFHPWFVLAGVPDDFAALAERTDVPAGLRAFAQYVLLPLVAVYLVILTAYLVRVLATRAWPSGWIGYLVSALAGLGILSLLLIHPERDEHGWIDRYARAFWIAILPSTAMLLLAAWKRIAQYGVTERRYLLTALALWLGAIAVYYAVTRSRNIKRIPATLATLALVTFIGPWSAYATSRRSQVGRLETLLRSNGVLVAGRLVAPATQPPEEDRRQMAAVLEYLARVHGTAAIDPWFGGRLAAIDTIAAGTGPSPRYEAAGRAALLLEDIGIEPVGPGPDRGGLEYFAADPREVTRPIAGFDYALNGIDLRSSSHRVAGEDVSIVIDADRRVLEIRRDGAPALEANLDQLLRRARRGRVAGVSTSPPDSLRLDVEGPAGAARIYFEQLALRGAGDTTRVESAHGDVYLAWRAPGPR